MACTYIVLGAGAIGCYLGGRLAAAGQAVTLVGRPRLLQAIAADGLRVTDLDGFDATLAPAQLGLAESLAQAMAAAAGREPPVILLCVKGGDTVAASREIAACRVAGSTVVSMQNGVDNPDRIRAQAPHLEVLSGMVPYNVVLKSERHVHRATSGTLQMQRSATSVSFAPLWQAAGLDLQLQDQMLAIQWGKLLLNLNNPVNALSDLPLREQLLQRDYRRVLADLQTETLGLLRLAGIVPAQVAALPPRLMPFALRLPDWLFARVSAATLRMDASARSSMADDLRRGRPTEIDDLCGAVVRLAQRLGASAPMNQRMIDLVRSHEAGQRYSGTGLRQALRDQPAAR